MFRTAALRTAASAVRAVARPVAIRRTAAAAAFAAPRAAAAAPLRIQQSVMGVRMYSAGGGLNKEEVEGRIMSLLQGFDKVSKLTFFCLR
jgi:NADH dehydrogenase (ubiquinone) 1 alpha/beta subcomplex 1